jgi:hypothetical protein
MRRWMIFLSVPVALCPLADDSEVVALRDRVAALARFDLYAIYNF